MIEYRSLGKVAFLMVMTLGLYGIFWFYWVSKEMLAYNGRRGSPGLWVVALGLSGTIPFIYAIPIWKFAQLADLTSRGRYNRFFFFAAGMSIVFIPVIVLLTQRLLNEIALEQRARMGGTQMDGSLLGGAPPGEEPPPGPDDAGPGDEPGDEPEDEPYIESEDIRTVGR